MNPAPPSVSTTDVYVGLAFLLLPFLLLLVPMILGLVLRITRPLRRRSSALLAERRSGHGSAEIGEAAHADAEPDAEADAGAEAATPTSVLSRVLGYVGALLLVPMGLSSFFVLFIAALMLMTAIPPLDFLESFLEQRYPLEDAEEIGAFMFGPFLTYAIVTPVVGALLAWRRGSDPLLGALRAPSAPVRAWLWLLRRGHGVMFRFLRWTPLIMLGGAAMLGNTTSWSNQYGHGQKSDPNPVGAFAGMINLFLCMLYYFSIWGLVNVAAGGAMLAHGNASIGGASGDILDVLYDLVIIVDPDNPFGTAASFNGPVLLIMVSSMLESWSERGWLGTKQETYTVARWFPLGAPRNDVLLRETFLGPTTSVESIKTNREAGFLRRRW